jgi:NAD(P)-dependent dehydrogenase (short-subunit alcohol dehydrogenase family)
MSTHLGTNALATDGGTGLGLACASHLLREGATVTIAGRTEQRLRAAALQADAPRGAEVRWVVNDASMAAGGWRSHDPHRAVRRRSTGRVAAISRWRAA